jgi:hypothetical protein
MDDIQSQGHSRPKSAAETAPLDSLPPPDTLSKESSECLCAYQDTEIAKRMLLRRGNACHKTSGHYLLFEISSQHECLRALIVFVSTSQEAIGD